MKGFVVTMARSNAASEETDSGVFAKYDIRDELGQYVQPVYELI